MGMSTAERSPHDVRAALAAKAQRLVLDDDAFAADVEHLVAVREWHGSGGADDPPDVPMSTLRSMNAALRARQLDDAVAAAASAQEVVGLLASVNDRRGVQSRAARGRLLSFKANDGRSAMYPRWQFDPVAKETIPDIERWIEACATRFAGDVVAFDHFVRAEQARLGGQSIAGLLTSRRWDAAYAVAIAVRDQDG